MAPPFLAYLAVATKSTKLLRVAVRQCTLYRQILQTNTTGTSAGLWHHIIGQANQDLGFWSTSNAWAAAGMSRVLATILRWPTSRGWTDEVNLLTTYIREILDAAMRTDDDNTTGLLRNYLDDTSWFGEISGTALFASVVYRMAILRPETFETVHYLDWANRKRLAVAKHVDDYTGIGKPAVNPLNHLQREPFMDGSPEGQGFLVLLHAAYRDFTCAKSRPV